jgi:DNA polymerase III delta prime subunit
MIELTGRNFTGQRLHLFAEEVVPRMRTAINRLYVISNGYRKGTRDNVRIIEKAKAIESILEMHEHRLIRLQTDVNKTLELVLFIQSVSRLDNLDDNGVGLAIGYMLEYMK